MKNLLKLSLATAIGFSTMISPSFAADAVTDETQVEYVAGATDPGGNGTYVITVPRDVVFSDKKTVVTGEETKIKMHVWDKTQNKYVPVSSSNQGWLPSDLSIKVEVSSENGMKLKNTGVSGSVGTNGIAYGFKTGSTDHTNKLNTPSSKITINERLTPTASFFSVTFTLTGDKNISVPKGTRFSDVLTFTEENSGIRP